jgi:hypothetical protein
MDIWNAGWFTRTEFDVIDGGFDMDDDGDVDADDDGTFRGKTITDGKLTSSDSTCSIGAAINNGECFAGWVFIKLPDGIGGFLDEAYLDLDGDAMADGTDTGDSGTVFQTVYDESKSTEAGWDNIAHATAPSQRILQGKKASLMVSLLPMPAPWVGILTLMTMAPLTTR